MKCTECPKWDAKENDCTALTTELGGDCLLRFIVWQLEIMTGALEEILANDDDDSEWWKRD